MEMLMGQILRLARCIEAESGEISLAATSADWRCLAVLWGEMKWLTYPLPLTLYPRCDCSRSW